MDVITAIAGGVVVAAVAIFNCAGNPVPPKPPKPPKPPRPKKAQGVQEAQGESAVSAEEGEAGIASKTGSLGEKERGKKGKKGKGGKGKEKGATLAKKPKLPHVPEALPPPQPQSVPMPRDPEKSQPSFGQRTLAQALEEAGGLATEMGRESRSQKTENQPSSAINVQGIIPDEIAVKMLADIGLDGDGDDKDKEPLIGLEVELVFGAGQIAQAFADVIDDAGKLSEGVVDARKQKADVMVDDEKFDAADDVATQKKDAVIIDGNGESDAKKGKADVDENPGKYVEAVVDGNRKTDVVSTSKMKQETPGGDVNKKQVDFVAAAKEEKVNDLTVAEKQQAKTQPEFGKNQANISITAEKEKLLVVETVKEQSDAINTAAKEEDSKIKQAAQDVADNKSVTSDIAGKELPAPGVVVGNERTSVAAGDKQIAVEIVAGNEQTAADLIRGKENEESVVARREVDEPRSSAIRRRDSKVGIEGATKIDRPSTGDVARIEDRGDVRLKTQGDSIAGGVDEAVENDLDGRDAVARPSAGKETLKRSAVGMEKEEEEEEGEGFRGSKMADFANRGSVGSRKKWERKESRLEEGERAPTSKIVLIGGESSSSLAIQRRTAASSSLSGVAESPSAADLNARRRGAVVFNSPPLDERAILESELAKFEETESVADRSGTEGKVAREMSVILEDAIGEGAVGDSVTIDARSEVERKGTTTTDTAPSVARAPIHPARRVNSVQTSPTKSGVEYSAKSGRITAPGSETASPSPLAAAKIEQKDVDESKRLKGATLTEAPTEEAGTFSTKRGAVGKKGRKAGRVGVARGAGLEPPDGEIGAEAAWAPFCSQSTRSALNRLKVDLVDQAEQIDE